ncbi:cytochrome b-245 heavy chain-like isoform X1 [Mercenaria mercenaria]|uniref:cytochrome b-245 heavy chain-like isoform X1 n=2 Tax=Mercenaria mercenaria TaxID=6596 RepID=UPI00234E5726|nr:cytochrome b-245 heavy chain-like isoform X1 [Mercenaria mercenaria]XP_053396258.1 cytochrome b-245 heavy chain-like isoform X1 [Mercenaria mercenaria]XP_053396259.1 cytochrome b-245 heavy chain-like isoform X1 [Mercenaria mercenaria]
MARHLNDVPRWIVIAVWIAANIGMFVYAYLEYKQSVSFYYLRLIIGDALPWARASAACLNLNCMLILIPVCRNLISFLRGSLKRCCKKSVRRQLDKHITFHRYIAYMICLHTAIHIGAHVFNVERMFVAHEGISADGDDDDDDNLKGLLSALSNLDDGNPYETYINPVRDSTEDPSLFVVKTVAGTSGIVATLALIIMVSSSTEVIRRSYFELFWFTHHLFVLFFIGICVHGLQGIVRGQTNTDVHDPEVCQDKYDDWGSIAECPTPQFAASSPATWKWVIGPLILYFVERGVRFIRSKQSVYITKVVKHPSNVFELQMKKKGFKMGPGQYIFLHCPKISYLEWHPFTLTSAPDDEYFSVHIRRVGNWTNDLAKACHIDEAEFKEAWKLPSVSVDGPFGTATEDIFSYEVDIFVAAGIGVTPFASVLKHICYTLTGRYKKQTADPDFKLKKVYFFWICPDTNAFEWLHDLLRYYDKQMAETGFTDFLRYFVYLTRGWDKNMAKTIVLHDEDIYDPVTGLYQKTHYGRPNWDQIMPNIAKDHPGTKIGVFFCGPKVLSSTLHKACNQHSSKEGAIFYYNKENF